MTRLPLRTRALIVLASGLVPWALILGLLAAVRGAFR